MKSTPVCFSLILMQFLFHPSEVHAQEGGGREGHGGGTVTCFNSKEIAAQVRHQLEENRKNDIQVDARPPDVLDQIKSVELLDLYSARRPNEGGNEDPILTSSEVYSYELDARIEAVRSTHFLLYSILKKQAAAIPFADWKKSDGVTQLNDAAMGFTLPVQCVPIQIANQQILSPNLTVVSYDPRLFERMGSVDQAALIFHEWIYHYMVLEYKAKDSLKTQLMIGKIFSTSFSRLRAKDFSQYLTHLGLFTDWKIECASDGSNERCLYFLNQSTPPPSVFYLNDFYHGLWSFTAGMKWSWDDER